MDDSDHVPKVSTNDGEPTIDDSTLPEAIEDADLVLNDLVRLAGLIRKAVITPHLSNADKTFDPSAQKHDELRDHLNQLLLSEPSQLEDRRDKHWDNIDYSLLDMTVETTRISRALKLPTPTEEKKALYLLDQLSKRKDAYWTSVDQDAIGLSFDHRGLTEVQERLIVANLRRSHRFAYSQRRAGKLEGSSKQPNIPANVDEQSNTRPNIETASAEWIVPSDLDGNRIITTGNLGETMTDTVPSDGGTNVTDNKVNLPSPSQQMSSGSSDTGSRPRYPKPPHCEKGAALFNCPCCCITLPIIFADSRLWRYVRPLRGYK